jgi:Protein of unknown function (DUF4232)
VAVAAVLAAGALAGCGNGLSTTPRSSHSAIPDAPSSSATPMRTRTATPARTRPATPARTRTATPARTRTATPPAATPPASASPAPQSPPASHVAGTATAPHRSSMCGPGDLAVGLRTPRGGGTAGSQYELLTFRNTSTSTCTMNGHPGVSFVGMGNGTQLGAPAARTGAIHTVRLAPGMTATALLQVVDAGNYDPAQCAPTTSDGLRVYPPDWRVSVFVPFRTQACQRDPGTSPQLTVSAVG